MQSERFRPSSTYIHERTSSFSVASKFKMNLNPRYISKISNSPRKIPETSHRMRPYFIPERSRTKSENADNHTIHHTIQFDSSSHLYTKLPSSSTTTTTSATLNNNATMMDFSCDNSNNIISDMYIMNNDSTSNDCDDDIISSYHIGTPGPSSSGVGVLSSSLQTQTSVAINKSRRFALAKKSKSLEDVRAENIDGSLTSHEMEFVSSRIQKLKF